MRAMSHAKPPKPATEGSDSADKGIAPGGCAAPARDDAMTCERCGAAEMYRMHAVWRCPACGYKTDCCGW